ncbi:MAG: hypothetical protein HC857_10530 [Synechococcales cyanobacterium RU_4_20]|nr:hypothetical protein [Synechococcales cyanobacterium RU_4_20]NJR67516.1 hypothetical protein [Synechococcales cyanobacterium CRU_2_2]
MRNDSGNEQYQLEQYQLEQYSREHSQEVLLVDAVIAGEPDQVLIFRGFSSSLVRPTAFDPGVPVLPERSVIVAIARLRSPYQPDQPQYLEQGLTWEEFAVRLVAMEPQE